MRRDDERAVEGRTRRGGQVLVVVLGLALLLALPPLYGLVSGDAGDPRRPAATDAAPPAQPERVDDELRGRLVFTAFDRSTSASSDRRQRLWILDLQSGELSRGPLMPPVEQLWVADRSSGRVVIVADDGGEDGVAYVVDDLSSNADPREVAHGDVISLSTDGHALIVGRTERAAGTTAGCDAHTYTLDRVDLDTADETPVLSGRLDCGTLVSATLHRELAVASFVDDGRVEVRSIWPQNVSTLFPDLAHVSVSPRGTFLFVDPADGDLNGLGVWPRTPTGRTLVWPAFGRPRPLVSGVRLFAQRVLGWSPDGGYVVVNGVVRDRRGMWLVYVPLGTAELLFPPNSFPLRSASGATFDDAGNVFAASPGRIVARTAAGTFPIPLGPDAPSPAGPIGWLP
jgi:hypothetical protein